MSDRIAVMDQGRILQVGTPTEVYDTPASRTVAEFVGTSNVLAGKVRRIEGRTQLDIGGGVTLDVTEASLPGGASVDVIIRPEHLSLAGSHSGGRSVLEGTIENVLFAGFDLRLFVRLANDARVQTLQRHSRGDDLSALTAGAPVRLTYAPQSLHVIPKVPA